MMASGHTGLAVIGCDAPLTDPAQDDFGYATFAQRIAEAICKTPSPQGLVVAVHGPWGVGKSTFLNFVKYDIDKLPRAEQPVVVDFNPWWFSNREDLAGQFLAHFRAGLPQESKEFRAIGNALAEYSGAIGKVIAGAYGIPWLDIPIGFLLTKFKRKPSDVPTLKRKIDEELRKAGKRFVFIVDDIDRLAPDEMLELFKVVKALADFPNVVYLLSFDRKLVAGSLTSSLGVDGDAYIEKIVQLPCSLPIVDPARLQKKLFEELDRILESLPVAKFDETYWGNVFVDGLSQYIRKPRDVVRIVNALRVLYPAAAGEVNPVDFIAVEFLRVFEPDVYDVVATHKDMFARHPGVRYSEPEKDFHNEWLQRVPADRRPKVMRLARHLFPRLSEVWGNMTYGSEWAARWRRELRVCSPEIFDVYFQFGVASDSLRRSDLDELVAVAGQPDQVSARLMAASAVKRPDGSSKAGEVIARLQDMEDELSSDAATGILTSLFEIGDVVLSSDDEKGGLTAFRNRWRLGWLVSHLMKRIPETAREDFLRRLVSQGEALGLIAQTVMDIDKYRSERDGSNNSALAQLGEPFSAELKSIAVARFNCLDDEQLLAIPDLPFVIYRWVEWSHADAVSARVNRIVSSDADLIRFLEKYLSWGARQGGNDRVVQRVPYVRPKDIAVVTDVESLEPRVREMLRGNDLTADQKIAGEEFLKGMERHRSGEDVE